MSLSTSFKILSNSFETSLRQNLLELCVTFFWSLLSKKLLLRRHYKSQKHMFAMHSILSPFLFQFFKFLEAMTSSKDRLMVGRRRVEWLQQR